MPITFAGATFYENPLAHYDQVGYRIGLHALHADAADRILAGAERPSDLFRRMRDGERDTAFPLAWTGMTDYLPRGLEIDSYLQGRHVLMAGVTVATTMIFRFDEPGGLGILSAVDALRRAGGWGSIPAMHWLVTVEFNGVIAQGDDSIRLGRRDLDIGRVWGSSEVFAWVVRLARAESTVDSTGAHHRWTLYPVDQHPHINVESLLPYGVNIEAETVGEALDRLMDALNRMLEEHSLAEDVPIREFTYRFWTLPEDHPAWEHLSGLIGESDLRNPYDWPITRLGSSDPKRQNSANPATPNAAVVRAAKGETVTSLVYDIVSASERHEILSTGGASSPATAGTANAASPWSMRYRVYTTVVPLDTSGGVGRTIEPRYRVVFHLVPHVVSSTVNSMAQLNAALTRSPESAASIIRDLAGAGALRKLYAHLYTGLNSEILELELDWNFLNALLVSYQPGADTSDAPPGAGARLDQVHVDLLAANASIGEAVPGLVEAVRLAFDPNGFAAPPVLPYVSRSPDPAMWPFLTARMSFAPGVTGPSSGLVPYFRTFPQRSDRGGRRGGMIGPRQYGRRLEISSTLDASSWAWPVLTMTIRGDPWWLPRESPAPGIFTEWPPPPEGGPPVQWGEVLFLYLTKVPRPQGSANALTVLDPEDRISGIYTAVRVTSAFDEDGSFTQKLVGLRSTAIFSLPDTDAELTFDR